MFSFLELEASTHESFQVFEKLLKENGVAHEYIAARQPQQNGLIERLNRTMGDQIKVSNEYRGERER